MLGLQFLLDWVWVHISPYLVILPFDLYLDGWGVPMNINCRSSICKISPSQSLVLGQIVAASREMQIINAHS